MAVAKSIVGRRFRLEFSGHRYERKGSRFLTEIRAGLATFFAMAYIISVNASIVTGKSHLYDLGNELVLTRTR
jgi:AGZA family xanthine/uracil permease-like MFS transporter